jgi:hypothetical protein
MPNSTIIEAVGFAYKPGRNTYRADAGRAVKRLFVWLLFRKCIPLSWRQRALFKVLLFARFIEGKRWILAGASKGDTFENDLLKLIFNATAIANIADNAASAPLTNLEVSLHTGDPGDSGNQTTSEATYTSYARVPVSRDTGGWTVTAASVSPAANIDFPAGSGGSGTVTHFAVGTAHSGSGKILYSGTVTPNIVTGNGITPRLTTATAITED